MPLDLAHCFDLSKFAGVIVENRFQKCWDAERTRIVVDRPVALGDVEAVEIGWVENRVFVSDWLLMDQIVGSFAILDILDDDVARLES